MQATEVLLYSAQDAHDVLGHWIGRLERGTFTHVALRKEAELGEPPETFPRALIVEAVWPRVRMVSWPDDVDRATRGATARVALEPESPERDDLVWQDMVGPQGPVGEPYGLTTLVMDALGVWLGHQWVVRLGGSVVCSSLVARYAQLVGDPRVPPWRDADSVTPADLSQMLTGKRTKPPG